MQSTTITKTSLHMLMEYALISIPCTIEMMATLGALIPDKDFLFPDGGKHGLPLTTDTFRGRVSYVNSSIWELLRHSQIELESIMHIYQQLNQYITKQTNPRNFWGYFNIIKGRVKQLERDFHNILELISHTADDCKEAKTCNEDKFYEIEILRNQIRLRMSYHDREINRLDRKMIEIETALKIRPSSHDSVSAFHKAVLWREFTLIQKLMAIVVNIEHMAFVITSPGRSTSSLLPMSPISKTVRMAGACQQFTTLINDLIRISEQEEGFDVWPINTDGSAKNERLMSKITNGISTYDHPHYDNRNEKASDVYSRGIEISAQLLEAVKYLISQEDNCPRFLQQTKALRSSSRAFRAKSLQYIISFVKPYCVSFKNYYFRKLSSDLKHVLSDFNTELNDDQFEWQMSELDRIFEEKGLNQHVSETGRCDLLYLDGRLSEIKSCTQTTAEALPIILKMKESWKPTHVFMCELLSHASYHEASVLKGISSGQLNEHINLMQSIYSSYLFILNYSLLGRLSFSWMMLNLVSNDGRIHSPLSNYVEECRRVRMGIYEKLEKRMRKSFETKTPEISRRLSNTTRQISHSFSRQSSEQVKKLEADNTREELRKYGIKLIFISDRDIPNNSTS